MYKQKQLFILNIMFLFFTLTKTFFSWKENTNRDCMKSIFNNSVAAAEKYGLGFDLIKGANIAGFEKVVEAMISQGIY